MPAGILLEFGQVIECGRLYFFYLSADGGNTCLSGSLAVTVKSCCRLTVCKFFRAAHLEQDIVLV